MKRMGSVRQWLVGLSILGVLMLAIAVASDQEEYHRRLRVRGRTFGRVAPVDRPFAYDVLHLEQLLDHFNFATNQTFLQRVLVSTEHWASKKHPIFFYCGNEGDIEWFAANTGFVWEVAREFGAMVVFAEHRYFGKSMPFGQESFEPVNVGFLSVSQAMADFATLIPRLKLDFQIAQEAAVIGFGGSYGGMLAAWMRLKYPQAIDGAIAGSAPILQFSGITDPDVFNDIVTLDYHQALPGCDHTIRASFDAIRSLAQSSAGRNYLQEQFQLCAPLESQRDANELEDWIINAYVSMAMTDYPYASSFLEPMEAWPVNASCAMMAACSPSSEASALVECTANSMGIYYNATGSTRCNALGGQATDDLGIRGWDYLACTSMVMPISQGKNSMFPEVSWDLETYSDACAQDWKGVRPRADWAVQQFGGKHISTGSNIVFSNGGLDPWRGGGVQMSLSPTLTALLVEQGAHHLDLRSSNEADPDSVRRVRQVEKQHISRWIAEKRSSSVRVATA